MASLPLTPDDAHALKWRRHKRQRLMVHRSLRAIADRAVEHDRWLRRVDWLLDDLERQVDAL